MIYGFFKKVRMSVFQRFKFGSVIIEILQQCFCVDCLQEIAFIQLVRATCNSVLIT